MKNILFKIIFFIVGIVIGVGGTFIYIQKYGVPSDKIINNIAEAEENKRIEEIVKKVNKLMLLPEGETPVLATINDADTLSKEQAFYLGSENGDVVLIYKQALKAIIYSPAKNVIINVGPVTVEDEN
jgi:hypothetical protein